MNEGFSYAPRLVALAEARLVYKCDSKKHITLADDAAVHEAAMSSPLDIPHEDYAGRLGDLRDEHEAQLEDLLQRFGHAGCEVVTVILHAGASPVELPPCRRCGGKMVLAEGSPRPPKFGSLPQNAAGLVDHRALQKLIAEHEQKPRL